MVDDPAFSEPDTHDADVSEQIEEEEETVSPEEAFTLRVAQLVGTLALRQAEVLRVSEYVDERASELNDAKVRAKRRVEQELAEVNEDALERYIRVFSDLANSDDDLSEDERETAFAAALEEIRAELPEGAESTYLSAVLRSMRPSVGVRFLHSSLLMTVVGELEMFVNQLARACFELRPGALDDSGRSFTWSEVSSYGSIDELRNAVVDRAIEDLLRGSLADWVKFFEQRFGIEKVRAASTFEAAEAVQRRHCIVHNAGIASPQYVERLADFPLAVEAGDDLPVDAAYLARACDTLFLVAYSLAWALGVKLNSSEALRISVLTGLTNQTMFLLQERRYELVRTVAHSVPYGSLKGEELEYLGFVIKVNGWIAHKELGTFDSIRDEVEQYPVRTRSDSHKLAKLALLDQHEEAHALAQKMIAAEELKLSHLLTWPLLRGVRDFAQGQAGNQVGPEEK